MSLLIARSSDIHGWGAVTTFVVSLVAFVVVCEHLVPMAIVRADPERVLDVLLPAFHPLASLMTPLTVALVRLTGSRRAEPAPGTSGDGSVLAVARTPAEAATEEGQISDAEGRELLQSVVDFTETLVREVMTPRPDIVAVSVGASLQDLRGVFREEQYSRMPVYRDNLDNVVGVVFVKDLVALPPGAEPPITTLMRSAYFVPESKRVSELLKDMQRRQAQMAVVLDEYGGTAGLVTVEDLLEEIVGEIRDEYDVESETVTEEGPGVFVFSGKVSVDEVRERLGITIEREGFETVGGYLLAHLGRMPYVGETFEAGELAVEVLEVERRRITKVRVRRPLSAGT
jgi:putative hemolysin